MGFGFNFLTPHAGVRCLCLGLECARKKTFSAAGFMTGMKQTRHFRWLYVSRPYLKSVSLTTGASVKAMTW